MGYRCPVCGQSAGENSGEYIEHTQEHIIDLIKSEHPEWVEKDGICPKCREYFNRQIKGE